MIPEELLDALDPDQRAVATQVAGPLAVLAGAGTGKTRAITYRIAYGAAVGAVDPSNVLAVTFTQRAAFEMRHRLAQLGVPKAQARTFHSAALRQLRHFWPTVVGGPLPDVIPHKASLVAASAARLGIAIDRTNVRDIAAEVEWAKVTMVDAAHYAARVGRLGREVPAGLDASDMARLLDVYEDAKAERGVIDFEDILIYLCGMLQERADVAAVVRKQYRSFVVDEFQDVNLLQARLLDLWLGGRHDVCVVGDVAQTIYSFTGASPEYLTGFGRKHPGARIAQLTRDYRSTPQIVALANDVLERSQHREGTVRLSSQRDGGARIAYRTYEDDRAEAEGVADQIAELIAGGMAPHSIAVLMRTNGQSQAFEEALGARRIPVAVAAGKPFFARDDVRTAIARLRAAAAAREEGALADLVRDVLSGVGWAPEAPSGQAGSERWSNMNAIVGWADDSRATSRPTSSANSTRGSPIRSNPTSREWSWQPFTPRKDLNGMPSSSLVSPKDSCPSPTQRPSRHARRRGGSSTWPSPAPGICSPSRGRARGERMGAGDASAAACSTASGPRLTASERPRESLVPPVAPSTGHSRRRRRRRPSSSLGASGRGASRCPDRPGCRLLPSLPTRRCEI